LRLMTSSNMVGGSTGISAGFTPLSILSTSTADLFSGLHSKSNFPTAPLSSLERVEMRSAEQKNRHKRTIAAIRGTSAFCEVRADARNRRDVPMAHIAHAIAPTTRNPGTLAGVLLIKS
jgi:hypothetical protein